MKKLIYVVIAMAMTACGEKAPTTTVEKGELIRSVYASCTVKSEGQYNLNSQVSGNILQINYEEGMVVDSGAVLMRVDNTNPRLNTENALLAVELAQDNYQGNSSMLKSLKLQLDLAKDKMVDDSLNFFRQQALWEQQIGSKLELEKKELAYQSAKNQYRLLQVQYSQTKAQAETALRQAQNNYQLSLENAEEFDIRAQRKGKIYSITKEEGETIRFQEVAAVLGSEDSFFIELEIDQEDVVLVEKGQKVFIRLDAYEGQTFEGEIRKLNPIMNAATQTFLAEADISSSDQKLFPGLTGETNIVIEQKDDVLTIPLSYLKEGNTVVLENGKEKELKTGLRSIDRIEVLEGLAAGDVIQLPAEE